jgi:hypothetical protein
MSQAIFSNTTRALSVIGERIAVATLTAGGAFLVGLATLV